MKDHTRQKSSNLITPITLVLVLTTLLISACGNREITISANEHIAIESLKTLAVNQRLYYKQHQGNAYGTFDQLISALDLYKGFAGDSPVISGYVFTMKVTPKTGSQPAFFSVNADPQQSEGTWATGKNHYYIDAKSDTVKVNLREPAGPNDPSVSD